MSLVQDIKKEFTQLNALEKIVIANVIVFILYKLLSLPGASESIHIFFSHLTLPSKWSAFLFQPWSIFTYAFLHFEFFHLLFNMIILFMMGRYFSNVFGTSLGLKLYFSGILVGGFAFLLVYNLFSGLGLTELVGASAGIRTLLIFLCAYMPFMEVRLLTFKIKLWYIGAFIVLIDFLNLLANKNFGGNIAHFGGSLVGYLYAIQLQRGKPVGKGFDSAMSSLERLFKAPKKRKLKTVHKGSKKMVGYTKEEFKEFNSQKRIDLILDKISKSGYDSLTQEEKEFLFKAGK